MNTNNNNNNTSSGNLNINNITGNYTPTPSPTPNPIPTPKTELTLIELQALLYDYIITYEIIQLTSLLTIEIPLNSDYSFYCLFPHLILKQSKCAQFIIKYPKIALPLLDQCLLTCQLDLFKLLKQKNSNHNNNNSNSNSSNMKLTVKYRCHVRLMNLPPMLHKSHIGKHS